MNDDNTFVPPPPPEEPEPEPEKRKPGKRKPEEPKPRGLTILGFERFFGEDVKFAPPPPREPPQSDPINSELPADCPVMALGFQGDRYFYLNVGGHVVGLLGQEHTRRGLLGLFGGSTGYLEKIWPRLGSPNSQGVPTVLGWRDDLVDQCLMRECIRQGPWDPLHKMRGPGAWADQQRKLILHLGDDLQADGVSYPPGMLDGYVYERGVKWPHPSAELAPGGPQGPAAVLLAKFKTWPWSRPVLDPYLQLGHVAAGKVGGALRWRPSIWLVGPPGSGKTTLEEYLLDPIYGHNGVIRLINPSEAGIRQVIRYSSLPTIVDELEPGTDQRRVQQVVALARYAASGGVTARGSASHTAFQFVIRGCYTFSSVYTPPFTAQDRSRITTLELQPLTEKAELPDLDDTRLRVLGRMLTRRLVEQWPRFPVVFECFAAALRRAGHNARACDQYGTLATCAYLALHDGEPYETPLPEDETAHAEVIRGLKPDDLAFWVHCFPAAGLAAENDEVPDYECCLDYLLGSFVDPRRAGERRTIGQEIEQLLEDAADSGEVESGLLDSVGLKLLLEECQELTVAERQQLREELLTLSPPANKVVVAEPHLYVANKHRGLLEVFAGTAWAGSPDKSGAGWYQAMRRDPSAQAGKQPIRFAGARSRVTILSLRARFGWKLIPK
jgi:hypothetical protein